MSEYRHGAFADQVDSQDYTSPSGVGTIPVYIGRAPVHQLADYAGKTNVPILISSWQDGVRKIGYSEAWTDYDLSEVLYAHFRNDVNSVGPIVVINALNPNDKKNEAPQTATVNFVKKVAVLSNPKVILSTIEITGKELDVDFSAAYSDDGLTVVIRDLQGGLASAEVKFYEVDPNGVNDSDIVTAINTGVPKVYYDFSKVPTILAAPGWSDHQIVFAALVAMLDKINGHWYTWLNADLDCSTIKTIDEAIEAKEAYETTTGAAGLLWPMAKKGNRKFHASTLNTVTMQWVDFQNNNIPYETPSNKQIDIDSLCLADGTAIQYDQTEANRLNAKGINTMTYWEGTWRMWGPHTMKYSVDANINARDVFDCNVRMLRYINNAFQRTYGVEVDKPMTRGRKDSILNDFQAWLDGLVQDDALLLGTVEFVTNDNPVSDLVQGDFVFSGEFTSPVPGKSLTSKMRWTSRGLNSMFGGES